MEIGGGQEKGPRSQPDKTGKVVRIPRDWFGPTDELVPFGPRGSEAEAEELGSVGIDRGDVGSGGIDPEDAERLSGPPDPNSFWDESSSSIQKVVEAPVPPVRAIARVGDTERRAIDVRMVAAGLVAVAIAGLSVVGFVVGHGGHRASGLAVASVSTRRSSPLYPPNLLFRRPWPRRTLTTSRKPNRERATRLSTTVQVVYHASQGTSSPPPQPSDASATSETSSTTRSSTTGSGSGATAATTTAPTHSSYPAFGVTGALGPMSSPDG